MLASIPMAFNRSWLCSWTQDDLFGFTFIHGPLSGLRCFNIYIFKVNDTDVQNLVSCSVSSKGCCKLSVKTIWNTVLHKLYYWVTLIIRWRSLSHVFEHLSHDKINWLEILGTRDCSPIWLLIAVEFSCVGFLKEVVPRFPPNHTLSSEILILTVNSISAIILLYSCDVFMFPFSLVS